jgi:hypothetical protein
MLILTSKTPWRQRPSGLVEIDRRSPQARGLVSLWPLSGDARDLTQVNPLTTVDVVWTGTPDGIAAGFSSSTQIYAPSNSTLALTDAITISMWAWANTFPTANGQIDTLTKKDGQWILRATQDGSETGGVPKLSALWFDGSNIRRRVADLPTTMAWHHYAMVVSGNDIVGLYVDGIQRGGATDTWFGTGRTTTNAMYFGQAGTNSELIDGVIAHASVNNVALTDAEVWTKYDPSTRWSLFQPLVRKTYFDLAAGGGGSTFIPQVIMVL